MSGRNHDNPRAWRFAPASLIMGATLLAPVQAEDAVAEAQSTALPPFLFGVMFKLNPKYISLLFTDPMGKKLLAVVIVLQILGALVIKKIVNIKV